MNVLITTNVLENDSEYFRKYNHEFVFRTNHDATIEDVKKADIIIGNIDLNLLDYATNLKYLHLEFAGSDKEANHPMIKDKVILTNSTGCYSLSIAEHVLSMILYFYKNLDKYTSNQKKHVFKEMGDTRSIYDSKVLIIGLGSIGKEIARRLHDLGAHVNGIKRTTANCPDYIEKLYTSDKLNECIKDADIIILCLPQNKNTIHIMNKERINLLKDGSLLINVGRGSAIDTDVLKERLNDGKIQAALDVFEVEPLPGDDSLWDNPNCLILPHATGKKNLWYTRKRLRELAIKNFENFITGNELENVVDFNTGYKKSNS